MIKKVSVDPNDNVKITLEGKDDDKDDQIEFDIVVRSVSWKT